MSIAENHGGLYKNLAELRKTNGMAENNLFKALGFEYHYVEEGNNIQALIEVFNEVKDTNHPVVVHIHTIKGKGYEEAEKNKEAFHWVMPFNLENKEQGIIDFPESYTDIGGKFLYLENHLLCKCVQISLSGEYEKKLLLSIIKVGFASQL